MVPLGYDVAVRVEDLAVAPEGGDGGGEVVVMAVGLAAEEAVAEVGGWAADYSIHHLLPWRILNRTDKRAERTVVEAVLNEPMANFDSGW